MTLAPPRARTIGALMAELADRFGSNPAISFADDTFTFADVNTTTKTWAKALLALGVARGDRVAILAGNHPDWLYCALGAARIGAVLAPLNTWYKDTELQFALSHSQARVLLYVDRLRSADYSDYLQRVSPRFATARSGDQLSVPELPALRHVVELGGPRLDVARSRKDFLALAADISDAELANAQLQVEPGDDLFYLYTSGSTARPKCVPIQHGRVIENNFNVGERQDLTPDDRTFLATPLFYGLAAVHALFASWTHASCVVLQEVFEAGAALEIMERQRCTVYYGLGDLTRSLTRHPTFAERELFLEKGFVGLSADDKRLARQLLGVRRGTTIYGLTETYGPVTMTAADDGEQALLETSGTPLPGWDVRIADPLTGAPAIPGDVGEVQVKGYVMDGYIDDAKLTAEAFTADGYFRTGDLARFDDHGRFIFHSRSKEMIKTRGINVSPLEVEQVLEQIDGVLQAHVVGIPDPECGEAIAAFVEADPTKVPRDTIRKWVADHAASFKVPAHVLYRTDATFPRVASGKIPRYQLRLEALRELGLQLP